MVLGSPNKNAHVLLIRVYPPVSLACLVVSRPRPPTHPLTHSHTHPLTQPPRTSSLTHPLTASPRQVFGGKLIKQPVVRAKLAKLIAANEGAHAWLERLTYEMCTRSYEEAAMVLPAQVSLLKYQATRIGQMVADDGVQIFGGRAVTKTGMGKYMERFNRAYKYGAILGGSEEIMADLGIKLAIKQFPATAKL